MLKLGFDTDERLAGEFPGEPVIKHDVLWCKFLDFIQEVGDLLLRDVVDKPSKAQEFVLAFLFFAIIRKGRKLLVFVNFCWGVWKLLTEPRLHWYLYIHLVSDCDFFKEREVDITEHEFFFR